MLIRNNERGEALLMVLLLAVVFTILQEWDCFP